MSLSLGISGSNNNIFVSLIRTRERLVSIETMAPIIIVMRTAIGTKHWDCGWLNVLVYLFISPFILTFVCFVLLCQCFEYLFSWPNLAGRQSNRRILTLHKQVSGSTVNTVFWAFIARAKLNLEYILDFAWNISLRYDCRKWLCCLVSGKGVCSWTESVKSQCFVVNETVFFLRFYDYLYCGTFYGTAVAVSQIIHSWRSLQKMTSQKCLLYHFWIV